jgi:hypothetical protein
MGSIILPLFLVCLVLIFCLLLVALERAKRYIETEKSEKTKSEAETETSGGMTSINRIF